MQLNWERTIQTGLGFGFNILNAKASRFPKFTIWLGGLAMGCEWWAYWVGLRLGPIKILLRVLVARSNQTKLSAIPLSKRLAIAGAGALLTGLMDAFQQLFPDIANNPSDNRTPEELKEQIAKSLKEQVAQKR